MLRNEAVKKIQSSKRIAIKVGTSLLTDPSQNNGINRKMIEKLREEILFLMDKNISPLLVTSGAVGMGRETLKRVFRSYNPQKDPEIVRKQALASIGQSRLMSVYADCFEKAGIPVAQLLITARDFLNRRAYVNIGNTIKELSSMGVLPIINENDTVCTEELNYGDNDLLSAACASLFQADLLVILTSVPGFIFNGERVPFLDKIGDSEMAQAHGPEGPGTGGMQTKLRAAQLCMLAGEVMTILPGRDDAPLQNLFRGDDIGTVIYYKDKKNYAQGKDGSSTHAQPEGWLLTMGLLMPSPAGGPPFFQPE